MSELRSSGIFLVVVALTWSAANAKEAAAEYRVRALHCEFHLPDNYVVQPDLGNSVKFQPPGIEFGWASLKQVDQLERNAGGEKEIESQRRGHLTVSRRTVFPAGSARSDLTYVSIRAFSEELQLFGRAEALADTIVSECLATVSPSVLQAAEHRSKGCGGVLTSDDLNLLLRGLSPQPTFKGGTQIGWRISGNRGKAARESLGLRTSDLITHVCGASSAEIFEVHGDVCCTSAVKTAVPLTIERDGKSMQIAVPMPLSNVFKADVPEHAQP